MRNAWLTVCGIVGALALGACDGAAGVDAGPDTTLDAGEDGSPDAGATVDAGDALVDAGPPTPDAGALDPFGAPCETGDTCASGICLRGVRASTCSRECSIEVANDCRAEQTLCLPVDATRGGCGGPTIQTGPDTDDAVLHLGDCVTRSLVPLGVDTDLFVVRAGVDSPIEVHVTPMNGSDVELEIYDVNGDLVVRQNSAGVGMREGLRFERWTATTQIFVLVKDAGSSLANPYEICVRE